MSSPEHEDQPEKHNRWNSALKVGAVLVAASVGLHALAAVGHMDFRFKV